MIPEDDEVTTTTVHVNAAAASATSNNHHRGGGNLQYYASGSTELATETPVTLTRLETVRLLRERAVGEEDSVVRVTLHRILSV
jgi:hypothetical protein